MNDKVILLVEDNPDDAELTLHAFRTNHVGNQVVIAQNGLEALDYLFNTGKYAGAGNALPAVVLLDLKLPKIDGIEVLKRIRANDRTRFMPVVILTSSKEQQDLINGYRFGCNSYVHKPVNFDEFLSAARQLGLYWLLLNEQPRNAP